MSRSVFAVLALLLIAPRLVHAQYAEMDYGPFLSHTFQLPNGNTTLRGIAVPFDAPIEGDAITPGVVQGKKKAAAIDPAKCGVLFDTELLRYSGYWNGGFITWNGVVFNGNHGANPGPAGTLRIATKMTPGWAKDGKFEDPRPIPHGPMSRDWGRYKGLYRSDKGIVFSYTVGDVAVLDMPGVVVEDKQRVFTRTLNIAPSKAPMLMLLADVPGGKNATNVEIMASLDDGQNATIARVFGGPKGTKIGSTTPARRFPPATSLRRSRWRSGTARKPNGSRPPRRWT